MSELQLFDMEQGSADWFAARAGIPTASRFKDILTQGKGGNPSKTRLSYAYELAGERITGVCADSFTTIHTLRGQEMEEEARLRYIEVSEVPPQLVGFMRRGNVGGSPDFLLGDDGIGEIKTKLPKLQIALLLNGDMEEHMAQCQGLLWISGRQYVDFVSYWPGLPLFRKRIERDEVWIDNLKKEVALFNETVDGIVNSVREAA